MLAIRMQRLGRKGHPTYRVVVQDSRQSPTSGKYVALLGSYDPHAKTTTLVKEKAEFYLNNGAQPSSRVASLFQSEGVKLPAWVKVEKSNTKSTKNPEKFRKNRPAEPETPVAEEAPAEEGATEPSETPQAEVDTTPEETAQAETEGLAEEASSEEPAEA